MTPTRKAVSPAWVLFFLSPAVAELLSGSAPPVEFFNPFTLAVLAALYGSGAVLCRELVRRWGKGWLSLLTLGAAYGILEEGLMVKSFFDPQWVDLGALGTYGRWGGVNWVWAGALTVYHAVFSIAIPIVLVELAFPARRREAWVGRRTGRALWVLLVADVLFGFLFLTPYRPPLLPFVLFAGGMLGLGTLARRLDDPALPAHRRPLPRPRLLWLLGLLGTLGHFVVAWVVPGTSVPPLVALLLMGIVAAGVSTIVVRVVRRAGPLGEPHRLALVAGGLTFFLLLAPLQNLDSTRLDNTSGMALVGLVGSILLVWLAGRIRARGAAEAGPAEVAASACGPSV